MEGRKKLDMPSRGLVKLGIAAPCILSLAFPHPARAGDEEEAKALLAALPRATVSLADGIRQASRSPAAAISAKYEMDDKGQLSLSVYTAAKGFGTDAEHNTLQETSGSPEGGSWSPEIETFADAEHVARASEQLALMRLAHVSLLDVATRAARHGGTVFSVTPAIRRGKPTLVALVADHGRVRELSFDLVSGAEARQARRPTSGR